MITKAMGASSNKLTHLWTIAELKQHAVVNLGAMDSATFSNFQQRMNDAASKAGITNPRIIIDIKFKDDVKSLLREELYPISEQEWEVFKSDAKKFFQYMPKVFVIDGNKFTVPI